MASMNRSIVIGALLVGLAPRPALAWSCDGHRAVALLAERLLSPRTIQAINAVLAASPVNPAIKPFCTPVPDDPLADAATWADDNRRIETSTYGWHFIDFPLARGGRIGDYRQYCPGGDCVIDAITSQYRVLTTANDPVAKGNALRYITHFVGDLHQPLHTTSNGDRGGNCLPITFHGQIPVEDERHDFRPNLHSVWDDGMIRRLMTAARLDGPRALATHVASRRPLRAQRALVPTTDVVLSWARETSEVARRVAYGALSVEVPLEPAENFSLASCDAGNHASARMAALGARVDDAYERASVPAVLDQLRLAAERLAATLKAAFPG